MVQSSQENSSPAPGPGVGGLFSLLPLLMFVPLFFLMFRRQKKEQQQREKLKKGDRIVTQAGLIGELVEVEGQVAKVKIASNTLVHVVFNTISPFSIDPSKVQSGRESVAKEGGHLSDKK
ncbi:preprotein translocase subunit YajC [Pajaroellobacter abortibovis]|uniref:preprotein translocase subunit YajC n=1 Tax=Pajaroellobacter abortibovis TaxID=1882918 RepID=UPI001561321D|nr:preprotein translocase subunit YajC [Pajaroellobacter abortibovis]